MTVLTEALGFLAVFLRASARSQLTLFLLDLLPEDDSHAAADALQLRVLLHLIFNLVEGHQHLGHHLQVTVRTESGEG